MKAVLSVNAGRVRHFYRREDIMGSVSQTDCWSMLRVSYSIKVYTNEVLNVLIMFGIHDQVYLKYFSKKVLL